MTSSRVPFFGHYTAKNKDIASKFCCVLFFMYLDHKYSGFDNLKILDFIRSFDFFLILGRQNRKIPKIRDNHFVQRSRLRRLAFLIVCYLKTVHSSRLQTFAFFTQNGGTWRHRNAIFSKIFSTDFSEILLNDVTLVVEKVWKVWHQYLGRFSAIEKTRQGGRICPPQRGTG